MPRTGGIYSPPAGTKGTPNTTIQSVPYNTLIDDLTADANAARPVTAGGTGATSASGARTALGVEIGTNVQAYDAGLQSIAGLTTVANQMLYTTGTDLYATTALTPFARTLLDDADAAAMKATLGLAAVASSGSASELTTGTLADARLPSTMTGKTFTGNVQSVMLAASSPVEHMRLVPTDFGAGKPGLFFNRTTTTKYTVSMYDGAVNGTLDLVASNVQVNGSNILTVAGGTLTGTLIAPTLIATSGNIMIDTNGNRHLWFRSGSGVNRGLLYHDNSLESLSLTLYNSSGAGVRGFHVKQDGNAFWEGQSLQIGYNSGTAELRLNAGVNFDYRILGDTGGGFFIQKSTNEWAGATNLVYWDSNNHAEFAGNIKCDNYVIKNTAYGVSGLSIGSGDNATYAAHNVRLNTWFGLGIYDTSSNACRIVFDARSGNLTMTGSIATGGTHYVGSAAVFTDGNMQFAGGMAAYGTYLSDALNARAVIYTGTTAGETNFTIGHHVLAYHTTAPVNNSTVNVWTATSNFGYTYSTNAVSLLSGTWRQRGGLQYSSGNYVNLAQRVA